MEGEGEEPPSILVLVIDANPMSWARLPGKVLSTRGATSGPLPGARHRDDGIWTAGR
jgi:hypothetical protein